jgi:hypothetical protein
MNLVSLLVLPAVIALRENTTARMTIAGISLVVLLISIAYSKRDASVGGSKSESVAAEA